MPKFNALTYHEIALQLCDGLNKTPEEIIQTERWLTEYALTKHLSMNELNELCWEDSNWVLNQIF